MNQMLLVEQVHLTFEAWFIKQFQGNLIPEEFKFSILDMRKTYLALCWKEETLWKEWCENAKIAGHS